MEQNNSCRNAGRRNGAMIFGFNLRGGSNIVPGMILVAVGALFLLGNLHIVHSTYWLAYWPVILIAVGLVQLVDASHQGARITGAVLMGAGAVVLADNLGYLTVNVWDLWP